MSEDHIEGNYSNLIEHQVDLYQHYREQALAVLRITLSFIGIILTAGLVLNNSFTIENISTYINSIFGKIGKLSNDIAKLGLNGEQGELIVLLLYFIIGLFLISSFYFLFIAPSLSMLKVLEPSVFDKAEKKRVVADAHISTIDPDFEMEDEKGVALHNSAILSSMERNIEASFRGLRMGFLSLISALILTIPTIVIGSGQAAVFALIAVLFVALFYGRDRIDISQFSRLLRVELVYDLLVLEAFVAATLLALVSELPDWLSGNVAFELFIILSIFFGPLATFLRSTMLEIETFSKLFDRNFLIGAIFYLLVLSSSFMSIGRSEGLFVAVSNLFELLTVILLIYTVILILGQVTAEVSIRILSRVEQSRFNQVSMKCGGAKNWIKSWKSRSLDYEY